MTEVRIGDASCKLVVATQPGGSMYGYFSGDRQMKAAMVFRWVVVYGAAQTDDCEDCVTTREMRGTAAVMALIVTAAAGGVVAGAVSRHAPDVTVQRSDGMPVHLADFKGKVVLVDFWASWCIPCKTSFPALDALYRELHPRGFEVLAINLDERRRDADTFLGAHPHVMTVAFDPRGEAPLAFKVRGMPTSVLIDRSGDIRYTHEGYSARRRRRVPPGNRRAARGAPAMKHVIRLAMLAGLIGAALPLAGCATVQPWQRGRLAEPAMTFDADSAQAAYMTHWQEAREGAAGGFGVQGGGCGCK